MRRGSISDTRAGIFICDVMGHGVRSALVTAIVRALGCVLSLFVAASGLAACSPGPQAEAVATVLQAHARAALGVADYGYVMENGRIVLDGPAASLRENEDIKEFYLGLNQIAITQMPEPATMSVRSRVAEYVDRVRGRGTYRVAIGGRLSDAQAPRPW